IDEASLVQRLDGVIGRTLLVLLATVMALGSLQVVLLRRGQHTHVAVSTLPSDLDGPLPKGSRVGTATVRAGRAVIARVPVITARSITEAGLGTRLGDLIGRPLTILALCVLLACSLPLVGLRRRVVRRRQALDAERRQARRSQETPVA
ncbi:MAG: hypothetical protein M3296_02425, partial [Actinomycetota bacterium]|nr:hypothetical protein [Actinomycetota bacterium]